MGKTTYQLVYDFSHQQYDSWLGFSNSTNFGVFWCKWRRRRPHPETASCTVWFLPIASGKVSVRSCWCKTSGKPIDMVKIPLFTKFHMYLNLYRISSINRIIYPDTFLFVVILRVLDAKTFSLLAPSMVGISMKSPELRSRNCAI